MALKYSKRVTKLLIPKTMLHKMVQTRAWIGESKGYMGEFIDP